MADVAVKSVPDGLFVDCVVRIKCGVCAGEREGKKGSIDSAVEKKYIGKSDWIYLNDIIM